MPTDRINSLFSLSQWRESICFIPIPILKMDFVWIHCDPFLDFINSSPRVFMNSGVRWAHQILFSTCLEGDKVGEVKESNMPSTLKDNLVQMNTIPVLPTYHFLKVSEMRILFSRFLTFQTVKIDHYLVSQALQSFQWSLGTPWTRFEQAISPHLITESIASEHSCKWT
jgi:hypothetical protein